MLKTAFSGAAAVIFAEAALPEDKAYINGFDADGQPFSFVGKDGKPASFDIDALDWIAREMKFKIRHQRMDWAAIFQALQNKNRRSPRE
jgi:polar amino acid transport system substrate-binding protein